MTFKHSEWNILLWISLLLITMIATAFIIVKTLYIYLLISVPILLVEIYWFLTIQKRERTEIINFIGSVNCRDFSRRYDLNKGSEELKMLKKVFNDINITFKIISHEREVQYHYLQKILELVDTGIVSYEQETGEIGWLNEAFKRTFEIPYLKNIHSLRKRDATLYDEIIHLKLNESKVVSITRDKQVIRILLTVSAMRSNDKLYKLLAFQNVNKALDETESKAWQKLLNVMTHEIMNSVAPISSLADTLMNSLHNYAKNNKKKNNELDDLLLGITTIKRRSEGLLKFTKSYQSLNKINQLNLTEILVLDLFENLNTLMSPTFEQKNIEFNIILRNPKIILNVDINLIEQVIINIIVNAIEAVKDSETPSITLSAELQSNGAAIIKISDNGSGISIDLLDKIFIPFFSTRKTGSGIGLSLCKQIMLLHKGNIQVRSKSGEGTGFILLF